MHSEFFECADLMALEIIEEHSKSIETHYLQIWDILKIIKGAYCPKPVQSTFQDVQKVSEIVRE